MNKVLELYRSGSKRLVEKHAELETTKIGILRGGNTGVLHADGRISGKCARITYLRFKGINIEGPDYSKELMFGGGRGNEDLWMDVLKEGGWDGPILREEECPIAWETSSGIAVTGRPDIVLCNKDKTPALGIELKLVSSLWTARDVGTQGKPKADHLMQAGHYAWKLGIPFTLCYTSRANFAITGWAQKQFPRQGQPGSEHLSYNDKGEPKAILPFLVAYELEWVRDEEEGFRLHYRRAETSDGLRTTFITTASIERYYEYVAKMEKTKNLGPRPSNLLADGHKANFNSCDYCPVQKVCDAHETNYAKWMSEVYNLSSSLVTEIAHKSGEAQGF